MWPHHNNNMANRTTPVHILGGQMKSKNGQKYVVNQKPDGYFLTKSCAALIAISTIVALIAVFLLTFFLLQQR